MTQRDGSGAFPFFAALGFVALAGAAVILFATRPWGAGLTPDSVSYISVARNVIAGRGFVLFDHKPMVAWPPLFPALLALLGRLLNLDPWVLAPELNAVLFGLVIYLSGWIAHARLQMGRGFALATALSVMLSIPLFRAAVAVWSEMLFLVFVLCSVAVGYAYLARPARMTLLLWAVTIALATLTRYVGVVLLLWAVTLIVTSADISHRRKVTHSAILALIVILPLAAWGMRNWALTGTLSGPRAPSRYTLTHNVVAVFQTAAVWYLPPALAANRVVWLLLAVVVGTLAGVLWVENRPALQSSLRGWFPVIGLMCFYSAFLVVTSSLIAYDPIDDRILAPLFVPLTWGLFALAEALSQPYRRRFPSLVTTAFLLVALAVGLRYQAYTLALNVDAMRRYGLEYGSSRWQESALVHYLRAHRAALENCPLYSNNPYVLYMWADLQAEASPSRGPYNSSLTTRTSADLRGTWPAEPEACLAWFTGMNWPHFFTLAELQTVAHFEPVVHLDDGSLYRVRRAASP